MLLLISVILFLIIVCCNIQYIYSELKQSGSQLQQIIASSKRLFNHERKFKKEVKKMNFNSMGDRRFVENNEEPQFTNESCEFYENSPFDILESMEISSINSSQEDLGQEEKSKETIIVDSSSSDWEMEGIEQDKSIHSEDYVLVNIED